MESVAVRKTEELDPALKSGLESVFGRPLQHGEAVTFISVPAHPAPPETVCREAFTRLEQIMDKAAEKAKDIPEDELDAAIDEVMDHVRKWPGSNARPSGHERASASEQAGHGSCT